MKEMMLLVKENNNLNINVPKEEKNKKSQETWKKYNDAQFASIVARNIHQKLKMNVGN